MLQGLKFSKNKKQSARRSSKSNESSKTSSTQHRRLLCEGLEDRRLLSVGTAPELPGMHLVDPNLDNLRGQVVYLDFDGAKGVDYNGPVSVEDINVPAFSAINVGLACSEQAIETTITQQVAEFLSPLGVAVTNHRPNVNDYSTIYVGGAGKEFAQYGIKEGLAESVDARNINRRDIGFVFSDAIASASLSVEQFCHKVSVAIEHEIGHLVGFSHDFNVPTLTPSLKVSPLSNVAYSQGVGTEAHQWITMQAYDFLTAQYGPTILSGYTGYGNESQWISYSTSDHNNSNIIEGTYDEDALFNPLEHFAAGADTQGSNDELLHGLIDISAYERADVVEPRYWLHAIELWNEDTADAFYYVGRVAHLLQDMAVPAHVHNDQHLVGADTYETWLGDSILHDGQNTNFKQWDSSDALGSIRIYADLRTLFRETANYTEDYDSNGYDGDWDGTTYPRIPFSTTELANMGLTGRHTPGWINKSNGIDGYEVVRLGGDLMPWAIEQTAALFRLYFEMVDSTPPSVSITSFSSHDPINPNISYQRDIPIIVDAFDSVSGVGVHAYKYEYRERAPGGTWTGWNEFYQGGDSIMFDGKNGYTYGFRVSAEDAARNTGTSAETYVKVELDTSPPYVVAHTPSGDTPPPVDHIDITFSEAMNATSVHNAIGNLITPSGVIPRSDLSVTDISPTEYRVSFSPQSATNPPNIPKYRLRISPMAEDLAGNKSDNDRDGTPGESDDEYLATFIISDNSRPYVVSLEPNGNVYQPISQLIIHFSEEIDDSSFSAANDLILTGPSGIITGLTCAPINSGDNQHYWVAFPTQSTSGLYTLTVKDEIFDESGNRILPYTGSFTIVSVPWVGLSGSDSENGLSQTGSSGNELPSVAIDALGRPIVAWSKGGSVYVKRWDNSTWVGLGGSDIGGGIGQGYDISVATLPDGSPFVVWWNGYTVYGKMWSGYSWVGIAGSDTPEIGIDGSPSSWSTGCSVAVDSQGRIVVAWAEETSTAPSNIEIYVKRYYPFLNVWQELSGSGHGGGISNTSTFSEYPSLTIDSTDRITVAWSEVTGNGERLYVRRWQELIPGIGQWYELAGSAQGEGLGPVETINGLEIRISNDSANNPAVAYLRDNPIGPDDSIYIKRWNGSSWAEWGNGSASGAGVIISGAVRDANIGFAVDGSGTPYLSYVKHAPDPHVKNNVYVKKLVGNVWSECGTGSDSGLGLSGYSVEFGPQIGADDVTMIATSGGSPFVVWDTSSTSEIYAKRYIPSSGGTGNVTVALAAESDSGVVGDRITKFNTPTIIGTVEGGQQVFLDLDQDGQYDDAIISPDSTGNYQYSVSAPFSDGQHIIGVRSYNSAWNPISTSLQITIDTIAPWEYFTLDPASDSGIRGDKITNDNTPTWQVTSESGVKLEMDLDSDSVCDDWTILSSNGGPYYSSSPSLGDNNHIIKLQATDIAGNQSSTSYVITIDTSKPAVISYSGRVSGINITFNEDVSGNLVNEDLVLFNNGTSQTIDSSKRSLIYDPITQTAIWTFTGFPNNILPAGNYSVSLAHSAVSDSAGNELTDDLCFQLPPTRTWDGGGSDNNWSTAANWDGNVAPSPSDNLVFPSGAARQNNVNDYPSGTIFGSIVVADGYHIQNNTLHSTTVEVRGNSVLTATSIVCDTLTIGSSSSLFATARSFEVGDNPMSSAVGDFNADGKADLAVTNQGSNTVSILLGNGNGTFQGKTDYEVGGAPASLAVDDFNADGKDDLAIANWGSNTVSILLGNGNGTFQSKTDYDTGVCPVSMKAADFNGDDKPDLAISNTDSYAVSILLGNGDGTFQSKVNYSVGNSLPYSVAVGDFNGDGHPDLATANANTSTVSILLGNGDGTFQGNIDYVVGDSPLAVAVGDFNSDGKLDLCVANHYGNTAGVLLGNGDGTFQTMTVYDVGSNPTSVAVRDFNGDGKLDLAVGNTDSHTVSILLGNGNGTFQGKDDFGIGSYPYRVMAADFNGDGKSDLAAANYTSGTVSVLLNTSPAAVGSSRIPTAPATGMALASGELESMAADLGGDEGLVSLQAAFQTAGTSVPQNAADQTAAGNLNEVVSIAGSPVPMFAATPPLAPCFILDDLTPEIAAATVILPEDAAFTGQPQIGTLSVPDNLPSSFTLGSNGLFARAPLHLFGHVDKLMNSVCEELADSLAGKKMPSITLADDRNVHNLALESVTRSYWEGFATEPDDFDPLATWGPKTMTQRKMKLGSDLRYKISKVCWSIDF